MNYLKKNINNSLALPADIMRLVYEYADPMFAVKKQIETADYDLDEIMYQRMKKYLVEHLILDIYYLQDDTGVSIMLNQNNINDRNLKDAILNYHCGYKKIFLWRHKHHQSICGLIHPLRNIMDFEDCLNYVDKKLTQNIHNYTHYPPNGDVSKYYIRELYRVWKTI